MFAIVWVQLGLLLLYLVILDLVCLGVAPLTYGKSEGFPAVRAYPEDFWLADFYAVQSAMTSRWHPYLYFLTNPVKSRWVNVDDRGLRATWKPPESGGKTAKPVHIFVFGGSTIFGDNARDDYTIPSLLAKALNAEQDIPVEVTNFGQEGFCSTQELIFLLSQLREDNIPDLVIFYDGINDVATAFENHAPGLTYDELSRSREFELLNPANRWRLSELAVYNMLRFSSIGLTAEWLGQHTLSSTVARIKLALANERFRQAGLPPQAGKADLALAGRVIDTYLLNAAAVRAVAKQFGFRTLFFWQPVLMEKKTLSSFEESLEQEAERNTPGLSAFFQQAYAIMREVGPKSKIIDLSGVFTGDERSYFTDGAHLVEAGNAVVVKAMLPSVTAAVEEIANRKKIPGHSIRVRETNRTEVSASTGNRVRN